MRATKIIMFVMLGVFGFLLTALVITLTQHSRTYPNALLTMVSPVKSRASQVIGFLPYWLIDKADKDYSPYLTTLAYFGLTIGPDGSIQQFTNPGESEPGWYALNSGKFDPPKDIHTSLVVFNGDPQSIDELIANPVAHAANLVEQVAPIMERYGFTDLNIDIESVLPASESAQMRFTSFIREVKRNLTSQGGKPKTITIDASPTDLIKPRLISLQDIEPYVDFVVLMTYDYHYSGSFVTGPVAPLWGAGIYNEFDTETGIEKALAVLPPHKVILGVPLYGYEWETITAHPRSAVLPGSGIVASNRRVEELLSQCATCSARLEDRSAESYLIYKDQETRCITPLVLLS
jgi:spore germination protein YaaH